MFRVGDKVKWTSQSSSYVKEKVGEVVAVVPPITQVMNSWPVSKEDMCLKRLLGKDWSRRFVAHKLGGGYTRMDESYLIAVPQKRARSRKLLYWPYAHLLEKVE